MDLFKWSGVVDPRVHRDIFINLTTVSTECEIRQTNTWVKFTVDGTTVYLTARRYGDSHCYRVGNFASGWLGFARVIERLPTFNVQGLPKKLSSEYVRCHPQADLHTLFKAVYLIRSREYFFDECRRAVSELCRPFNQCEIVRYDRIPRQLLVTTRCLVPMPLTCREAYLYCFSPTYDFWMVYLRDGLYEMYNHKMLPSDLFEHVYKKLSSGVIPSRFTVVEGVMGFPRYVGLIPKK